MHQATMPDGAGELVAGLSRTTRVMSREDSSQAGQEPVHAAKPGPDRRHLMITLPLGQALDLDR